MRRWSTGNWTGLSGEFALFVLDVVATHGTMRPMQRAPIFFLSLKDFATLGEKWKARVNAGRVISDAG